MKTLLKSLLWLPRMLLGAAMLFLPGIIITTLLFAVFFPDTLGIHVFSWREIYVSGDLSMLEQLVFFAGMIFFAILFDDTKWGKWTRAVAGDEWWHNYDD